MKYPIVLQHSEEDCGAACLATVAKHYGKTFALSRVREVVGTGSRGTTLLGLRRGAETLGFNARQVRASSELVDRLDDAPLPAIIHWGGNHWAVLYGQRRRKYMIADPAAGVRSLSRKELGANWTDGIMLLLVPDENRFYEQKSDQISGFGRFLRRAWPYRYLLLEATVINFAVGLLGLAFPILLQILTDDVLVRGDTQLLTTVAVGVILMNVFRGVFGLVQSHLIGHFGQRLQLGLTLDYGYKLLRLPLSYFDSHRSGEVVSRLADVRRINGLIAEAVSGLPSQLFVALVSLALMLFYSWQLTVAAVVVFLLMILVNLVFLPTLRERIRTLIIAGTENQGFLVETFRGALLLKTTRATHQAWDEYQQNFGRLANLRWGTMKLGIYRDTITTTATSLTTVGLLWLGSFLVINGTLSIGQLLAFYGMSLNFLGFLMSLVSVGDEFLGAQVVIHRLAEVLDATAEEADDTGKPWARLPSDADVVCTRVNFHHVGRVDLLKDFDVTIPGGKVTALIGQSGCGKSTLVKLLLLIRFVQQTPTCCDYPSSFSTSRAPRMRR